MASKSRFLSRNANAYTPEMLGKTQSGAELEKRQRENFFKNIVLHTKKAEEEADKDAYNVKHSTVRRAKEEEKANSKAVLGGLFSRARKSGRGLKFERLESYRTATADADGQKLDNGKMPEKIPDKEEFGGKETKHKVLQQSTAIDTIDYNPKKQDLLVKFRGGTKRYLFPKVPEEVVRKWLNASSKGRFYNKNIKQFSVAK